MGSSTQNLKSGDLRFNSLANSVFPITKVYRISEIFNLKKFYQLS